MFHAPKRFMINHPALGMGEGNDGFFLIPGSDACGRSLYVQSSDDRGWEHVSVSLKDQPKRCPSWDEMVFIKSLWWGPEDTVMQLHVPAADHISYHHGCLHLWRPIGVEIPRPPSNMVA